MLVAYHRSSGRRGVLDSGQVSEMTTHDERRARNFSAPIAIVALFAASFAAIACSSSDDGEGATGKSGVAKGKAVGDLTPTEIKVICNWIVGLPGSGQSFMCGDETVMFEASPDECIGELGAASGCKATVEEVESCSEATREDPCKEVVPECTPLAPCATGTFVCANGERLPPNLVCNGVANCPGGKDEMGCPDG